MVIFMVWQKKNGDVHVTLGVYNCLHDLDTAGRKSVHGNKKPCEARSNKKMLFDYIYYNNLYCNLYFDILDYSTFYYSDS